MKKIKPSFRSQIRIWLLGIILITRFSAALAQGTAFTYQGQLQNNGVPANGIYNLQFWMYGASTGGMALTLPVATNGVGVSNGLFAVALDFGSGVWTGQTNWLEIRVETNGAATFTTLAPRQQAMPVPYAIFAGSASDLVGTLPAAQLSGMIANGNLPVSPNFSGTVTAGFLSGSGANVTGVNAASLGGQSAGNFWQLGGYNVSAGQFIGSTNDQAVEVWVNGGRTLRLEPGAGGEGAPNLIGGAPGNYVAGGTAGATIAGGGATNFLGFAYSNSVMGDFGAIGGGIGNTVVYGDYATVSGGYGNTASGNSATVGGGYQNTASSTSATVGGGYGNLASGYDSTVAGGGRRFGGDGNTASGDWATVGGGYDNTASGNYSVVGGGGGTAYDGNIASGDHSTVGGGHDNTASGGYSVVAGGGGIYDSGNTASGFSATVGGGYDNLASADYATVPGGYDNTAGGIGSFVGGGGYDGSTIAGNQVQDNAATIAGGLGNTVPIGGTYAFIGGGQANTNASIWSSIGGGDNNGIQPGGLDSTIGGGGGNTIFANNAACVIVGGSGNRIEASDENAFIGGGYLNVIGSNLVHSTIGGGLQNTIETGSSYATIAGGNGNLILAGSAYSGIAAGGGNTIGENNSASAIAGGSGNSIQVNDDNAFIGGGYLNVIGSNLAHSTIGGGVQNTIETGSSYATIAGGNANIAGGQSSTVGGGQNNTASGADATVPGGWQNLASGKASFAAGSGATAQTDNSFVWSDGSSPTIAGTNGQFVARASGGFAFYTDNGGIWVTLTLGGNLTPGDQIVIELAQVITNRPDNAAGNVFVTNTVVSGESLASIAASFCAALNQAQVSVTVIANGPVITLTWPSSSQINYALWLFGLDGGNATETVTQNGSYGGPLGDKNTPTGVELAAGSGSWSSLSDRNAKSDFAPVNSLAVLAQVASLPMTTWSYKSESGVRHIGPMAQDFHAAFLVGEDERHITEVDESGVALAAIQGLNQKLDEKEATIREQGVEIAQLKQSVAELKRLVQSVAEKK